MNVHQIDRRILLTHLHAVEEKFPLRFVGLLERGSAPHVVGDEAVDLLAEKREGLSLLGLAGAEVELSDRLGRPVAIILRSELHGNDEKRILAGLKPL
jgi:predicted nucleotidyltransferase